MLTQSQQMVSSQQQQIEMLNEKMCELKERLKAAESIYSAPG